MTKLHTFKPGDEVQARDGREARIYAVHPDQTWMYIGAYRCEDGEWQSAMWADGGRFLTEDGNPLDLIPKPKPKPLEGWLNVTAGGSVGKFDTREGANQFASPYRIACIDLSDYEEGHGI